MGGTFDHEKYPRKCVTLSQSAAKPIVDRPNNCQRNVKSIIRHPVKDGFLLQSKLPQPALDSQHFTKQCQKIQTNVNC